MNFDMSGVLIPQTLTGPAIRRTGDLQSKIGNGR
jgi:hypothetical protein